MGYGTGAIMGVPGHDERDLEFARKFELPILPVVQAPGKTPEESIGFLGGRNRDQLADYRWAADAGSEKENHRVAGRTGSRPAVTFVTNCATGFFPVNVIGASRSRLFGETASTRRCRNRNCRSSHRRSTISSRQGQASRRSQRQRIGFAIPRRRSRETNTMPQWAGSCWYYLRFCDPRKRFGEEATYWMGGETKQNAMTGCGTRHRHSHSSTPKPAVDL